MKTIQTGNKFMIYDDSIQTFNGLPVGTYNICFDKNSGCYLRKRTDISVQERAYGVQNEKVEMVLDSFAHFNRSLGIILSGDKGIGKSMFAKKVCQKGIEQGIPAIIVDNPVPGLSRFLESIDYECVVLFDEFDKMFRYDDDENTDNQASLLSLFDGVSGGKKLFIVTCNELCGLNNYIVNRPGRFHYHFRFEYPAPEEVREYLKDNVNEEYHADIESVVTFSRKVNLNYDCLRAISFELNMGKTFKSSIRDLNIMTTEADEYNVYLEFENGEILHSIGYSTNMFDIQDYMASVRLYDENGIYILTAYYSKNNLTYDYNSDSVMIDKKDIKVHKKDFSDNAEADAYKNIGIRSMRFKKKKVINLHYFI